MPIDVAIAGAAGRTGRHVVAACAAAEGMRLVAALSGATSERLGHDAGRAAGVGDLGLPLAAEPGVDFDVLVDFSTPAGTRAWLAECVARGRPIVIGTTGHDAADERRFAEAAERIALVRAPNMGLGVHVLRRVAAEVARTLASLDVDADVEIVDAHHRGKKDAPSGTARALAADVARARPEGSAAPRVHSLRLGGRPGDHAVHFGLPDETLTLAHSAHSRRLFAAGALRAARWVVGRPPGAYDMQDVLFGPATDERP